MRLFCGIVNLVLGSSSSSPVCRTRRMSLPTLNRYKNHCVPAEMISHGGWCDSRFCPSYCDVEELLFVHGVIASCETMRKGLIGSGSFSISGFGANSNCRSPTRDGAPASQVTTDSQRH
jgi:hypothetical protein